MPIYPPVLSGSIPQSNYLAADVTIAAVLTLYDGPSISLGAGTWLVMGALDYTGPVDWFVARMWDGTTVYESHATYMSTATAGESIVFPGTLVVLAATTTVKLSAGSVSNTGGLIKATAPNYGPFATGTTGKVSNITAIRVA